MKVIDDEITQEISNWRKKSKTLNMQVNNQGNTQQQK
jgi:hypothetical protein